MQPSDMQPDRNSKPKSQAQKVGESYRYLRVAHHYTTFKARPSSSYKRAISAAFEVDLNNQSFSATKPNSNPKYLSSLEKTPHSRPKGFDGSLAAFSSLDTFHIESSSRNAELFHFCRCPGFLPLETTRTER